MNRLEIIRARLTGLPTRLQRRAKRAADYLARLHNSAVTNGKLWNVIRRIPGERIDPSFNPDRVKQYAAINVCIYCGERDISKLRDEHILAYCLGGDAILPKASCTRCEDVTKKIEQYCGELFLDVRALTGTHSRRAAVTHLSAHDRSIVPFPYLPAKQLIPRKDHPGLLALPMFDPPGMVMGRPPNNEFTNVETFYRWVSQDADNKLRELKKKMNIPAFGVVVDLDMFARFIAKTAHCIAVSELGLKGFRPLLLETIRDGKNTSYHIGCPTTRLPEAAPMKTWGRCEIRKIGRRCYVVVFFRVYAHLGTPMYTAVVGEFIPWWKRPFIVAFRSQRVLSNEERKSEIR
jgi:hypothetical protein